jgi:hypothetical protein
LSYLPILLALIVAFTTTQFFATPAQAESGVNQTINFQGRLSSKTGGALPDGYYNIQFKIYQDGAGNAVGNPGGTLKWSEAYVNNGNNEGVLVRNSMFSVNLGSATPFGTSVDWNQSTLWLSLNVAGSAANCSSFGAAGCGADGEMIPMKRITASPYALNAGAVGGKTAENFIQMAQGVQTDASANTSSIFINKTGTGNLVQLQSAGSNVFSVTNRGDLEFGNGDTRAIYIGNAADNTTGNNLVVHAGYGGSGAGSMGGGLFLQGGAAGGDNAEGGSVAITGGVGSGTSKDGSVYIGASDTDAVIIGSQGLASGNQAILIGDTNTAGGTTNIKIGNGANAEAGTTAIQAKDEVTISANGTTRATFNQNDTTLSGNVVIKANGGNASGTFQVQNAAGESVLKVDTTNNSVAVGSIKLGSGTAGATTSSLWNSDAQAVNSYNDSEPINLGTTFKSDVDGLVTGVKFYSPAGANAAGTDVGKLWACTNANCSLAEGGTQLAAVTFPADATAGWKTATFSTPVQISANTYYVVTYLSNAGIYHATSNYFLNDRNNAPLHAMKTSVTTNGSFKSNEGAAFPSNTFNGTNYWVDVAFQQQSNVDTIKSDNSLVITSDGSVSVGSGSGALNLQGSSVAISAANGGNVSLQGGTATIGNQNGGNVVLKGGAGSGTGTSGLVVLNTPTFSTITNDANCYTGGALVASNCTVTNSTVNDASAVLVGFNAPGKTASLPDPGNATAGRILYLMAAGDSANFTLLVNGGGAGNSIEMRPNTTATLLWNGTDWTASGATNMTPLEYLSQDGQVNIGDGQGDPTLLTVDKAAAAPVTGDHEALLGSMYYDTTKGTLQCYESEGWGNCSASPDTFVSLSPEYANAVVNGTGTGTMSTDLCSDALNINDGSSSQPTICGTNETYNFYNWTSPSATAQTRSLYVTYQLPSNFKEFVDDSVSLTARTDNAKASVEYQLYKNSTSGLTACGTAMAVSAGPQTTWQKQTASTANCNFAAGDSIVFRVTLSASANANAYVSTLGFAFSNQ